MKTLRPDVPRVMVIRIYVPIVIWLVQLLVILKGEYVDGQMLPSASSWTSRGIPFPDVRFTVWDRLDRYRQSILQQDLRYTIMSWNTPGTNDIERNRFMSMSSSARRLISRYIVSPDQWDCYVHHYQSYSWAAMEQHNLHQHLQELGWDMATWQQQQNSLGFADPTSIMRNVRWEHLSKMQRNAALELCYNEQVWNGVPLELWVSVGSPTGSPTRAPFTTKLPTAPQLTDIPTLAFSTEPPTSAPIAQSARPVPANSSPPARPLRTEIPDVEGVRYVVWMFLNERIRAAAELLTYNEESWNLPGTAQVEQVAFHDLNDVLGNQQAERLVGEIGLTQLQWDCYINHYFGFSWDELAELGLHTPFNALGWNLLNWSERFTTPGLLRDVPWIQLNETQQSAATTLCYQRETWEKEDLRNWRTSTVPSPSEISVSPTVMVSGSVTVASTDSDSFSPTSLPSSLTPTGWLFENHITVPSLSPSEDGSMGASTYRPSIADYMVSTTNTIFDSRVEEEPSNPPSTPEILTHFEAISPTVVLVLEPTASEVSVSEMPSREQEPDQSSPAPSPATYEVKLPGIMISWSSLAESDLDIFSMALLDFIQAVLFLHWPEDLLSINADVKLDSHTNRGVVIGVAYMAPRGGTRRSSNELEKSLVLHFITRGSTPLINYMSSKGIVVTDLRLRVTSYETSVVANAEAYSTATPLTETRLWVIIAIIVSAAIIFFSVVGLVRVYVLIRRRNQGDPTIIVSDQCIIASKATFVIPVYADMESEDGISADASLYTSN